MERRLTAIFAADVVGSSTAMAPDETGTPVCLNAHLDEVFDPWTVRQKVGFPL